MLVILLNMSDSLVCSRFGLPYTLGQAWLIDRVKSVELRRSHTSLARHEAIGAGGSIAHEHTYASHFGHAVGCQFLLHVLHILGTCGLSLLAVDSERKCK